MLIPPHPPSVLRAALAAAAAVAVTGLASCSDPGPVRPELGSVSSTPLPSPTPTSPTVAPSDAGHDDADVMFLQMMIPHHQQAVEMGAMMAAKHGIDPQVAGLARRIASAQGKEIATMSGWLGDWGQSPSPSPMGMDHEMGGMMSAAEMSALDKASGAAATKLFLTGMIKHHQGAVTMAEDELSGGQNTTAKQLAQQMVESQTAEIGTMRQLLSRR